MRGVLIKAALVPLALAGCAETIRGQERSPLPPGQAVQVSCKFPDGKVRVTGIDSCRGAKGEVVP